MKLYYSPGACSLAPHILLEEIGQAYERELIDSMDGSTESEYYRRINPKGRVPALAVNDRIVTEVAAIMTYLAMSTPDKHMLPNNPEGVARCLEWMSWLSSNAHALAVAQNWRTERFSNDVDCYEGIQAKGMENLALTYGEVNERLLDLTWAVDGNYSIVDPYLLVFYRWGNRLGLDMTTYSNWTRHAHRMLERKAVQTILAVEGISVEQ